MATPWSRRSGPVVLTSSGAERLGVPEGPAFAALQRGEAVEGTEGSVRPEQVIGEPRAGRRVVITGDTGALPGDR